LINYLEYNNLIYDHQYGFRPKHSTIHPILHLLNDISSENDKITKDTTLSVFLDITKAFDSVNHNILLQKLEKYGIRGLSNKWFKSYLSNRCQYTNIKNSRSEIKQINYGVPQGSVLGPILFLVYINDIHFATDLKVLSFADDTTLYHSCHNPNQLEKHMNLELVKIYKWLCSNRLTLNITKTRYMNFTPNTNSHFTPTLKLNDNILQQVGKKQPESTLKFLGVTMDQNQTWKPHIETLKAKLSFYTFTLNKIKNILPKAALKILYYSLIHSSITYAILAWGNARSIKKIFQIQKRAIRIINHKPYNDHTNILFKNNQILKVQDIYKLQAALFMHDYKNKKLPNSFQGLFKETISKRQSNYIIDKCRTTFSYRSPRNSFVRVWNKLDNQLKNIENRSNFKSRYKNILLGSYN
jgi:hypothetical protein